MAEELSLTGLIDRVAALDRAVVQRVAETDSWVLDEVMPRLSQLADHSVLWMVLASGLRATGNRWARRAAWRGLGSIAVASATVNILGKSLTDRKRPDVEIPVARQLARVPWTTSFPSGHAASAAAFATGVALESPRLAVPVIVLAAAVGFSRVVTGVHYPSDVLAGFAIGAAAGAATLRWWPRRPPAPAAAIRPPRQAPAAPAGEDLVLVVNKSAGTTSSKLVKRLRADLPHATIIESDAGQDLSAQLRSAAAGARILGVAGGDGTINAASTVALEMGLPLLVIPAGTFNHFAADLGIESAEDAVAAVQAGEAVLVDVGVAGSRSFVNTSSTGVYVDLVNARQRLEGAVGKRPAAVIGLIQVLRRGRPHELIMDGRRRRLWLYFCGNCRYEPQGMAPSYRPDLSDGYLDIRVVDAAPLARSRLVASVVTGTLGRCRVYHAWQAGSVSISSADGAPIWLSVDGEVATAESSFRQGKRPHGLLVYRTADRLGVSRRSWPFRSWRSRAAVRRDSSQDGGGANSGAIGDDDNAARRPPATVQPNAVQQTEDLRDTP
jgi:diacylglycerol kinase family enzyme/membrane-associated phospholipid phosphatase